MVIFGNDQCHFRASNLKNPKFSDLISCNSVWTSPAETLMALVPNLEEEQINQKIREKLGWLVDYELELIYWNQIVALTRGIETKLKQSGLNHQSLEYFEQNKFVFADSSLQYFQQQIFDYIAVQSNQIKNKGTFLAT